MLRGVVGYVGYLEANAISLVTDNERGIGSTSPWYTVCLIQRRQFMASSWAKALSGSVCIKLSEMVLADILMEEPTTWTSSGCWALG